MSSKGFKVWNIIDGLTNLSICFGEKIKRIDIRHKNADGIFMKDGVSLTASEFKFCLKYVENYKDSPSVDLFFDIKIQKDDKGLIRISKKDRPAVTTNLDFWDKIKPLAPALIYIISASLPVETLLDLYIVCRAVPQSSIGKRDWITFNLTDGWPNNSWLHKLGIFDPDADMVRTIDGPSLNRFAEENKDVYDSLIRLMYLYKEV